MAAEKDFKKIKKAVTTKEAKRESDLVTMDRIKRLSKGLLAYQDYVSSKKTSLTADKLEEFTNSFAINAPGAKIERLPLYIWDGKFYRPEGEVRIPQRMEWIRKKMLARAKAVHGGYDLRVKRMIDGLRADLKNADSRDERVKKENEIKELQQFLELPGNLEMKNSAMDEICSRLKARSIRSVNELNQPPSGGTFRIALRDCTIEGELIDKKLRVRLVPFDPSHLLTYAFNANLLNKNAAEQAADWWIFTVKTMGLEGARKFYEHLGYAMVTVYPLPTERTIYVLIGEPGSSKGTHFAAVEGLLSFDELKLFAKASPHKLVDPREHFSLQNLAGKLAVISGDLKHTKIRDFSEINDITGGEPQEIEKKFRDPTTENPIFKTFWASTPPLFKVDQAGGAWRRVDLGFTNLVPEKDRNNAIKPKMLGMLDGFFLNGLIGLSYLATNGWHFTGEQDDATIEELWAFHSDSVQVWAQNLNPEPDHLETNSEITSNSDKREKISVENQGAVQLIDDLYSEYKKWCAKKQIEPVKPKTFSTWLGEHDFIIKRQVIQEGRFVGKRKRITYGTWSDGDQDNGEEDGKKQNGNPESNRAAPEASWKAYFSRAPLTITVVPDSHGHSLYIARGREENSNDSIDYTIDMPPWIGQHLETSPKSLNSGLGKERDSCPIRFENATTTTEVTSEDDTAKSQPEPVKSAVPDEKLEKKYGPVTIEEGNALVSDLKFMSYHISEHGASSDGQYFKICIVKPLTAAEMISLKKLMAERGWEQKSDGEFGMVWFVRPLREGQP